MKAVILFLSLILVFVVKASELPDDIACYQQIQELAIKWNAKKEWKSEEETKYVTQTSTFGSWVIYKVGEKESSLIKEDQLSALRVTFNNKTCEFKTSVTTKEDKGSEDPKNKYLLTDREVQKIISVGKGVFYFISPSMPLSLSGVENIQKAAQKFDAKVFFVMDPKETNKTKIELIAKNNKLKEIFQTSSYEFEMQKAYLHFPSLLFYSNGKILPYKKYGHDSDFFWDLKRAFK